HPIDRVRRLARELRVDVHPASADADGGLVPAVEGAIVRQEVARSLPLLAQVEPYTQARKVVPPDRQGHTGRDRERTRQKFVGAAKAGTEPIAILELDRELSVQSPRLEPTGAVLDVGHRADPGESAHRFDRPRPG